MTYRTPYPSGEDLNAGGQQRQSQLPSQSGPSYPHRSQSYPAGHGNSQPPQTNHYQYAHGFPNALTYPYPSSSSNFHENTTLPPPYPVYQRYNAPTVQAVPPNLPFTTSQFQPVDPSRLQKPVSSSTALRTIPMGIEQSQLGGTKVHQPSQQCPPPSQRSIMTQQSPTPRLKTISNDSRRSSVGPHSSRSPATLGQTSPLDTLSLLIHMAEDMFSQASKAVRSVANSMSDSQVQEHHMLISFGLACLQAAARSGRVTPRQEVRLHLRVAAVLVQETTDITEAETALTRGIAICVKHRFTDLKYSSQFLLMKTVFQRNPRSGLKLIDSHISDCQEYKHFHWLYAFRFLKASFSVQSGGAVNLDNLRAIAALAQSRGDKAIWVLAILLEGMVHLHARKSDWVTRVQTCIAQASKFQLDGSAHVAHLDVLLLLMDVTCAIHEKAHDVAFQKMSSLQAVLDGLKNSVTFTSELLLPIKRHPGAQSTISHDTRAILRPGTGDVDYLVLAGLGLFESFALAYAHLSSDTGSADRYRFLYHGFVGLYKATTLGRSTHYWKESIKLLSDDRSVSAPMSLPEALDRAEWNKRISCYCYILIGLQQASLYEWEKVDTCLKKIERCRPSSRALDTMILYLSGVFYQGTAKLDEGLQVWASQTFDISTMQASKTDLNDRLQLPILATFNRLWVMQDPSHSDDAESARLLALLCPLCENHPDQEMRTAWDIVLTTNRAEPSLSISQIKRHLLDAMSAKSAKDNKYLLAMALTMMRYHFFNDVVGEQAVKAARAAAMNTRSCGNLLWASVADGMLAHTYQAEGKVAKADQFRESGTKAANEVWRKMRY